MVPCKVEQQIVRHIVDSGLSAEAEGNPFVELLRIRTEGVENVQ